MNFNIEKFLDMKNEEILKENNGKKFDIVLMNPPYDNKQKSNPSHLEFVKKCLNIADKQISIFPYLFITKSGKKYDNYKKYFNEYIESIEEVNAHEAFNIGMGSCGIYKFNNNKNNSTISIYPLNNNAFTINNLLDISIFNGIEKDIINYLGNDNKIDIKYFQPNKSNLDENLNTLLNRLSNNNYYLTANAANGGMNAQWFSSTTGKIFNNKQSLKKNFIDRKGAICFIISKNNYNELNNIKLALIRPLMRLILLRMQTGQSLSAYYFKYIPDIDWEDDRVKTDEGLLEVCGCPKDKCKEYADYCKKIIDEIDKK